MMCVVVVYRLEAGVLQLLNCVAIRRDRRFSFPLVPSRIHSASGTQPPQLVGRRAAAGTIGIPGGMWKKQPMTTRLPVPVALGGMRNMAQVVALTETSKCNVSNTGPTILSP